ncbi:LLM class flavin-dependent oxidoreductase [Flexivirga lutea]
MRVSVMYPMFVADPQHVVPFAELVQRGLADRLWAGTSLYADSSQLMAYLAGAGYRIPCGLSVQLSPTRHPYQAALEARSLALLSGSPVVAGFGAGPPNLARELRDGSQPSAREVGRYIDSVRSYLQVPATGLVPSMEHPPVELGAGVLRPRMAEAAGRWADVAITLLTPTRYISEVLAPALAAGARARSAPPRIASIVHVAVAREGRAPAELAYAGFFGHLTLPHYTDMLRRAGIDAHPDDPVAGSMRISEAQLSVFGSPADIADELREYAAAGVDEVVLSTAGVLATEGPRAALIDALAVLRAVHDS